MPNDHVLDRPVWSALTSVHAALSEGADLARKFRCDVSPLAGLRDATPESAAELRELVSVGVSVVVAQAEPISCPEGLRLSMAATAVQMIFRGDGRRLDRRPRIEALTEADAPEMLSLSRRSPDQVRIASALKDWGRSGASDTVGGWSPWRAKGSNSPVLRS